MWTGRRTRIQTSGRRRSATAACSSSSKSNNHQNNSNSNNNEQNHEQKERARWKRINFADIYFKWTPRVDASSPENVGMVHDYTSNFRLRVVVLSKCVQCAFFASNLRSSWLVSQLVSWYFEPSQPLGIISGLKTNFNPSLSYSACKSLHVNRNMSTVQ